MRLCPAPFADNFRIGLSLIQSWRDRGLLEIPGDTVIYNQLKSITKADLEESPETKFHALNALRFAIGAFEKYRPTPFRFRFNRPRIHDSGPNDWMIA